MTQTVAKTEELQPHSKNQRVAWWGDGLALAFFVGMTMLMVWPVVQNVDHGLEQWGDALLQTWTLDWDAHALLSDPLHFANANAFYPYANTLAFSETLIGQAVLVAPLIWLTGNPVLGYNVLLLGSFVLCGWATYLLVKGLTDNRLAGLVAGLIFAFFPHRFGQLSHLHLLTAQWMPFCMLFLYRFLRKDGRWRDAGLFGFFLALQLLSSTYLGLFLGATIGLYLSYRIIFWFISTSRQINKLKAVRLIIILAIVGIVVAPFYWPYLQVQQDLGFQRSASEVQSFSAQPFYYLDVPKENWLNRWFYRPTFTQGWWQSSSGGERGLFLGLIAIVLAVLGLFRRKSETLFYGLLALLAISFTFGPFWQTGRFGTIPLPYALLYNFVPGYAAIRVPVRFIYVVALAVAVLAGFGVTLLQSRLSFQKVWQNGLLAIVLIGLIGGEYWSEVSIQPSNVLRQPAPAVEQWLDAHPAPALHVPLSGSDNSNLFWQYWTRGSWRPIMNGFSGFLPPAYDALKKMVAQEGFSPRVVQLLQGLEVHYLVIESADETIKPQWSKFQADLAKSSVEQVAQFGTTLVYEIKSDAWLVKLKEVGLTPDSRAYFVEYHRGNLPLLELTASYLERTGTVRRENLFGTISMGFRALPALPIGQAADFLILAKGEDPTLYDFQPNDQVFGNALLAVYKKSGDLVAQYDFVGATNPSMINRSRPLHILPDNDGLKFDGATGATLATDARYLTLGLVVTVPQKLTLGSEILDLQPGLSICRVALPQTGLTITGDGFSVLRVGLWRGVLPATVAELRTDVLILSAKTSFDPSTSSGLASVQIVRPNPALTYSATLDVYNTPSGSHPSGHYGYWSVPLTGVTLDWQLDLVRKQVLTRVDGQNVPNYPPDPKVFDITKYGNFGDFRANLTIYTSDKLLGTIKLFDFTNWADGNKNKIENRHAGAFKGYDTTLALLVLSSSGR